MKGIPENKLTTSESAASKHFTNHHLKYIYQLKAYREVSLIFFNIKLGLHCTIFAARESERLLWELSFRLSG